LGKTKNLLPARFSGAFAPKNSSGEQNTRIAAKTYRKRRETGLKAVELKINTTKDSPDDDF